MVTASLILAGLIASVLVSLFLSRFVCASFAPSVTTSSRYGAIDGLRGLLALSVVAHHFAIWLQVTRGNSLWVAPDVAILNQLGAGAVGLFFMITGLLFYPKITSGIGNVSWVRVYVGRVFRILPMVVLSIVIVMSITGARTGRLLSAADLPALVQWVTAVGEPGLLGDADAGRTNAYVLWSLWYEWMFYILLLPILSLAMDVVRGRLPSWTVPAALLVLTLGSRLVVHEEGFFYYAPLFAVGMLAAEISGVPAAARALKSRTASIGALLALVVGTMLFHRPTGFALPLFAVFFVSVACGNDCFGLLTTRSAALLGEISFGVYLVHGCVLSLFFVEGASFVDGWSDMQMALMLPLLATATTVIAYFTYRSVERPSIDLGRVAVAKMTWEQEAKRVLGGYGTSRRATASAPD